MAALNASRYWALDIGGTKLGLSVGTADGALLARARVPMDPDAEPEAVIADAAARLRVLADEADDVHGAAPVVGVGAACPGPMSSREGRFVDPPNMPRWHGFALRDALAAALDCDVPLVMMNDANASVLAEWRWGAARGAHTAVYFTMSTGMGAGLVIGGRLHEGPDDLAGEIGHIRLDPDGPVGFGKRGGVEGYLSGPGIAQLGRAEARIALQVGGPSAMFQKLGKLGALDRLERISAHDVCAAAAAGDIVAGRAIDRAADALGRLIAMLTDLLNPDVFVLGTIGTAWPDLFIPGARAVLDREAIGRAAARVRIETSSLGDRRGDLSALAAACHQPSRSARQPS